MKAFSLRLYLPPLRNLCFTTHQPGTQMYLCMAGDTLPIIQQLRSHCLVWARTVLACSLFHRVSQSGLSFKFPITAFFAMPLQGITSQKGSMKKASLDISQGSSRLLP